MPKENLIPKGIRFKKEQIAFMERKAGKNGISDFNRDLVQAAMDKEKSKKK